MRIVAVENGLIDMAGHHANNAMGLKIVCEQLAHEVTFLVNKRAETSLIETLHANPCFSLTPYDRSSHDPLCGDWESFFYKSTLMADEFLKAFSTLIQSGDIIFFSTATPVELRAAELIGRALLPYKTPRFVFNFVFSDFLDENLEFNAQAALYRFAANQFLAFCPSNLFLMTANGNDMAGYLTRLIGVNTHRFPMPKFYPSLMHTSKKPPFISPSKTIGVFGDMRNPKGLHLLPKLVESNQGVRWIIQTPNQSFNKFWGVDANSMENNQRVHLVSSGLSHHEYYTMFSQVDIILTAYEKAPNKLQSSGLLAEAAASGKIMIAPLNSWVAEQVNARSLVCISYEHQQVANISHAIQETLRHWDSLDRLAKDYSSIWRQTESIHAYLKKTISYFMG